MISNCRIPLPALRAVERTTLCTLLRCSVTAIFCLAWMALGQPALADDLAVYNENWPPISFNNGDKLDGMAVELVTALQKRVGSKASIQLVPWNRGYKALLEEPNVMLFTVGRSEEREKRMTLVGPIAVSSTVLYTRKGNAARLLALGKDIHQVAVGAYRGSIFADTALKKKAFRPWIWPPPRR